MTREDRILAQLSELAEESRSPLAMQRDYPGIDPEIASLLPIHTQLKQLPRDIALPSTAKARLRAQLMAEFRETMVEREAGPWYRRAMQRFTGALTPVAIGQALSRPAAFAAALALAITTTGVSTVSAAMESIPGDALYPVKTTLEEAWVNTAPDVETKAHRLSWRSRMKMGELEKGVERGNLKPQDAEVLVTNIFEYAAQSSSVLEAAKHPTDLVDTVQRVGDRANPMVKTSINTTAAKFVSVTPPAEPKPGDVPSTQPSAEPTAQSTTPVSSAPTAPVTESTVPEPSTATNPTINAAPLSQPLNPRGVVTDNGGQNAKGSPLDSNPVQPVVPEEKTPSPIKGDTGPASAPVAASSAGSQLPQQPKTEQPAQPAPAASQPAPAAVPEAPKAEPAAPAPVPSQPAQPEKSDPLGSQPVGGGLTPKAQGTQFEPMKDAPANGGSSLTPKVQGDTGGKGSPLTGR